MVRKSLFPVRLLAIITVLAILVLPGCKDDTTSPEVYDTDAVALQQLALEDSINGSFEAAFNDTDPMSFLGKTTTEVYPIRIGRRVTSVSRNFNQTVLNDTAYVTVTYNFTGNFFLAASYDSTSIGDTSRVDTLIVKPFTSVVSRKLIFARVNNLRNPKLNWKLVAVSLPDGGTVTTALQIKRLAIYLPSGDSIVVTSPNDYFLTKFGGNRKQIPVISRGQAVKIKLEVFSAYAGEDIAVATHGANLLGRNKEKHRLLLVSSVPAAGGYDKVYEQTIRPLQAGGLYHALVDLMSRESVFSDNNPYENKVWGFPYYIR